MLLAITEEQLALFEAELKAERVNLEEAMTPE
jgi:hypothetical protein